jgi:hypothetical protein
MEDVREQGARPHAQGQPWLKSEEERVGVLLWTLGITTFVEGMPVFGHGEAARGGQGVGPRRYRRAVW